MRPQEARAEFEAYLSQCGRTLEGLDPGLALEVMIGFYSDVRANGCLFEEDADALLFQWGTYDWGQGDRFEVDITRQFIFSDATEEDMVWQLSLTFLYPPTQPLRDLGSANRWCFSLADLASFRDFLAQSPPLRPEALPRVSEIRLEFGQQ